MDDDLSGDSQVLAARAIVQRRCADAYLHEVRGSLQALVGAVELLGRIAKVGPGDPPERAERAVELARRALGQHEKITLELVKLLTFTPGEVADVDLRSMADELAHLLRNDLAARHLSLQVHGQSRPWVNADRGALHAVVAALLWAAIDVSAPGTPLHLHVAEDGATAVLRVEPVQGTGDTRLLTAVHRFCSDHGGGLFVDAGEAPLRGTLRLTLPRAGHGHTP